MSINPVHYKDSPVEKPQPIYNEEYVHEIAKPSTQLEDTSKKVEKIIISQPIPIPEKKIVYNQSWNIVYFGD